MYPWKKKMNTILMQLLSIITSRLITANKDTLT